jgi:hypothetical protein
MTPSDISGLDAVALAAAIRARHVSCVEVMTAYLDRIERLNPRVNAIVSLRGRDVLMAEARERDARLARGDAVGPLHGFPHAVKDVIATAGIPTTYGSPIYRDFVPEQDAIVVRRLKRAGAIVIGKTNVPEFGLGSHTFNEVFGATRNPYDPRRSAGGSSGGATAALASRLVPLADGSDYAGSLRNPAAWNNVFSLRTSPGLVPRDTRSVLSGAERDRADGAHGARSRPAALGAGGPRFSRAVIAALRYARFCRAARCRPDRLARRLVRRLRRPPPVRTRRAGIVRNGAARVRRFGLRGRTSDAEFSARPVVGRLARIALVAHRVEL